MIMTYDAASSFLSETINSSLAYIVLLYLHNYRVQMEIEEETVNLDPLVFLANRVWPESLANQANVQHTAQKMVDCFLRKQKLWQKKQQKKQTKKQTKYYNLDKTSRYKCCVVSYLI